MEYQLINVEVINSPTSNEDGISRDWAIRVESGIVGNTYIDFNSKKLSTFRFLKTDSQAEIEEKMRLAAINFVKKTYPNT